MPSHAKTTGMSPRGRWRGHRRLRFESFPSFSALLNSVETHHFFDTCDCQALHTHLYGSHNQASLAQLGFFPDTTFSRLDLSVVYNDLDGLFPRENLGEVN